jgi:phospholipid-binding lipoprotein MlaA
MSMRSVLRPTSAPGFAYLLVTALIAGSLAGCATPPPASDPDALADYRQTNDPLEPTNRFLYRVSDALDVVIMRPIALLYRAAVPEPARTGMHNVLDNIGGPVRFANDVLQGQPKRAGDTAARFAINTTVGIGGIFDVAKMNGIPNHDSDFALTLAYWGVPEGPFLFLPVIGPSSPRDAAGYGVDVAIDPFTWIGRPSHSFTLESYSKTAANAVDQRSRLLDTIASVKKTALDPYATFRSLYRQNRASKLENLRSGNQATVPDLSISPTTQ